MLHFDLRINGNLLSRIEVQRREHLDLSDRDAIADVVSTYNVRLNGRMIGQVRHRYGDRAPTLARLALELIEKESNAQASR